MTPFAQPCSCQSFLSLSFAYCRHIAETKRRRPCVFCRGDWYAQGNHARDAASRRRSGDDEGIGPHRQAGTFVYSSPELCLPFRTITSLSTEDNGILPHSPGTYKPPQKNTQKNGVYPVIFREVLRHRRSPQSIRCRRAVDQALRRIPALDGHSDPCGP